MDDECAPRKRRTVKRKYTASLPAIIYLSQPRDTPSHQATFPPVEEVRTIGVAGNTTAERFNERCTMLRSVKVGPPLELVRSNRP